MLQLHLCYSYSYGKGGQNLGFDALIYCETWQTDLKDNFSQQLYKVDSENVCNVDSTFFAPCLEMQCFSWHRKGVADTTF